MKNINYPYLNFVSKQYIADNNFIIKQNIENEINEKYNRMPIRVSYEELAKDRTDSILKVIK